MFEGHTDDYAFRLEVVREGFQGKTCWVHARAAATPDKTAVLTMQKLHLIGSDVFLALNEMRSIDGGHTWSDPAELTDVFARQIHGNGIESVVSDFVPGYHARTGSILGTGHTVWYENDHVMPAPRKRDVAYSVCGQGALSWSKWRVLKIPDPAMGHDIGAGAAQRYDCANGEILLPVSFRRDSPVSTVTVLRCSFDGQLLTYLEHGDEMTVPSARGMGEPSMARVNDDFFLTIRHDERGYVSKGSDGLHFGKPKPWTFDDGNELGNYNTQQHWVTHHDKLYLVYTRRGLRNDHIARHRAPLLMAEVNKDSLCVIRDTEQIMIPERGARLGNFGITPVSEHETWIVATEWMQTTGPDPFDSAVCRRYGSNNAVFICKVLWT